MLNTLKKIISESSDKVLSIPYISEAGAEALAEYLLANGVIAPSCKAGQTDYIERETAKEMFKDTLVYTYARGILDECPAADVVAVVRCKDCRRWTPDGGYGLDADGNKKLYGKCSITGMSHRENSFCNYGSRHDE